MNKVSEFQKPIQIKNDDMPSLESSKTKLPIINKIAPRRYAELIIFGSIFATLVASIFILNYFLAIQSSNDSAQTFSANRAQRAWQRATKNLALFNLGFYGQDDSLMFAFPLFKQNIKTFDSLFTALEYGGNVYSETDLIRVSPIEQKETYESFSSVKKIWSSMRTDFMNLSEMNAKAMSVATLDRTMENLIKQDDAMLDALSLLILQLSENSNRRLKQAQVIQVGAVLLSLGVFVAMAIRLTISLRRSDEIIEARNQEVIVQRDEIMREKETIEQLLIDLTHTQAQLIQSEKMASLGQMVAGLAHEINTPLNFVLTNIGVIDRNVEIFKNAIHETNSMVHYLENGDLEIVAQKIEETKHILGKINDLNLLEKTKNRVNEAVIGLDRIKELIINLKNFSRLDEADVKKVNLNENIESALMIAHNIIKYKAEVETHYAEDLFVECYPAQLNQVFLNVISNAAQAIPEFGKITITTEKNDFAAVIRVADTGVGISEENLKKIFEPFFTTKPIGQGTGLGLTIVYKIIEKHNGTIRVKSKQGEGTEFEIKIPLRQEKSFTHAITP